MSSSMGGHESALERYLGAIAEDSGHSTGALRFPAQTVGDVMTRGVVTAHEGALFKEVAVALDRNRISGVPVIDSDRRVLGVVTASDLLTRIAGGNRPVPRGHRYAAGQENRRKQHATTAKELMTSPAITTTSRTTIADAARLAAKTRVRTLPVVDQGGVLIGIVTRGDLIKLFLRKDEDIRQAIERDVVRSPDVAGRGRVRVQVEEGVVTLSGSVDTDGTARRIAYDAAQVVGVVDVHDKLEFAVRENVLPIGH